MGSRDPGLYVWLCGEVLAHFLALQFMLSKTPEGLEGSINSPIAKAALGLRSVAGSPCCESAGSQFFSLGGLSDWIYGQNSG